MYTRGKSIVTPSVVIYYSKNRTGQLRLGITTSKKIGNAVKRNRARRIIREAFRTISPYLRRGYDYILVARHPIPKIDTPLIDEVKVVDSLELYIISIKDNKKYGPLTLNEYLFLKKTLAIDNELSLNLEI